jgi:flagella basal body P-ring formation protein FlgA
MTYRFLIIPTVSLLISVMMGNVQAAEPGMAPAVMLNPRIVLDKDVLTVGDLFEPGGPNADHVLAMAPAAGTDLTLTCAELQRVADAFHLDWHSDDPSLTAVIERNAMLVTPDMLAKALAKADLAGKIDTDAEIAVQSPANGVVMTGQDMPDITFEAVSYDPLSQKFTATAVLTRGGDKPVRTAIAGVATRLMDVPVLNAPVERGARIGSSDITVMRLPVKDVRASMINRAQDLIGMVTRRTLDPQKPILKADLVPPVLIHRNEIVTVTYKNGAMSLTTKAKALANGVKGEVVQLENPSSKKLIEATVTGPQQAIISLDDTISLASN